MARLLPGRYTKGQLEGARLRNEYGLLYQFTTQLSSLKVPAGYRVILYEYDGFTGDNRIITADTPCLWTFLYRTKSLIYEVIG
jgi:hypothetical protein